jgi:hypothetical protein
MMRVARSVLAEWRRSAKRSRVWLVGGAVLGLHVVNQYPSGVWRVECLCHATLYSVTLIVLDAADLQLERVVRQCGRQDHALVAC